VRKLPGLARQSSTNRQALTANRAQPRGDTPGDIMDSSGSRGKTLGLMFGAPRVDPKRERAPLML
jgi:hypothetical protein